MIRRRQEGGKGALASGKLISPSDRSGILEAISLCVGDVWTWTALDADSKLVVRWYVGGRQNEDAAAFMTDLSERVSGRIQLTTDVSVPNPNGRSGWRSATTSTLRSSSSSTPRTVASAATGRRSAPALACAWTVGTPTPRASQRATSLEPDDAHRHAPLHTADQRLQQEARQPHACDRDPLPALQLREGTQEPVAARGGRPRHQADPGDGGWHRGPHLDLSEEIARSRR